MKKIDPKYVEQPEGVLPRYRCRDCNSEIMAIHHRRYGSVWGTGEVETYIEYEPFCPQCEPEKDPCPKREDEFAPRD